MGHNSRMSARTAPYLPEVQSELRTPRLLLRRPDPADAHALRGAIEQSLPELRRWMVWAQELGALEDTLENLRLAAERFDSRENLRYHIWSPDGRDFVGSTGFHGLDWRVPKGEIGYWIATPHTGQGYAQEITEHLTEYGLQHLGFRRIEIRCDAANERSARIPPLLGYTLDARRKNDDVAADDPTLLRDTLIFSRVR